MNFTLEKTGVNMKSILWMSVGFCALLSPMLALSQVTQPRASPLGTLASAANVYSDSAATAVMRSLPAISAEELSAMMKKMQGTLAAQKTLAVQSTAELEKLFSIRSRGEEVINDFTDSGDASYQFSKETGRARVLWRQAETKGIPREKFAARLEPIRATHLAIAEKIGIQKSDIFFVDFRETLSQSDADPRLGKVASTPIESESATSTILRAVDGVMIDGSFLRMSSMDEKSHRAIDLRWPAVQLGKNALSELRPPKALADSIIKRVDQSSKGSAINVRMAVVMRAMDRAKPSEFVPMLRVAIKPQSLKTDTGFRTDAGEMFYMNLATGLPEFADADELEAQE
jgi:hypothetical protein